MSKINIAVIGCGRIAQTHFEACQRVKETNLVAVADINSAAAESVASQFDCKPYASYKEMIAQEQLDAVIVCTPPVSHAEIALQALSQGLHLMCEKPFAINVSDAIKMVKVAKQQERLLMMASKFRFVEDVRKAKEIIESGVLGEIVLYENVFCSHVDMTNRWNSNKSVSGGGVLIDNAPHSVDIVRFLLGPIIKVQAKMGKQMQKVEVEDTCRLSFETESKVLGSIDLSWSLHKGVESYIDVYGTEGVLSVGWRESKYQLREKQDWVIFGNGYDKLRAFINQHQHFIDCIAGKTEPMITSKDSLESVKVVKFAYQSSEMEKWINVC